MIKCLKTTEMPVQPFIVVTVYPQELQIQLSGTVPSIAFVQFEFSQTKDVCSV